MPEVYKVDTGCVFSPPGGTTSEIEIPVHTVNSAPTPVHRIYAYPPSGTSWEHETSKPANRYADIYFTTNQFTTLKNNVKTRPVWISYDAPDIPGGNDLISNQTVYLTYP